MTWDYYQRQIITQLNRIETKVGIIMSQQDEINAAVTELQSDDTLIAAEITKLEAANPTLDLTALKAAVAATTALTIQGTPPAP